jgi:hypothetical protein
MDTPKVVIHSNADGAETAPAATASKLPPGTVIDAKGRKVVVRPLNPIELYRLAKVMGQAADSDFARNYASFAACVREFDGEPEAFVNSDREIEAMMQRLGTEGLEAVNQALDDLRSVKTATDRVAAKN